jgi:alkaline phosphatase
MTKKRFHLPVKVWALFGAFLVSSLPLFAKSAADKGGGQSPGTTGKAQAKYVFLFIGDGMSMAQINSAEVFSTARASGDIQTTKLSFTQFPVLGLATTYDAGTFITDSSSAATAMATGKKTLSGVVSMDPTKTVAYKSIAEYAKEAGRKVGIVTSVTLNHATPAAFYAKVPSRGDYYDIGVQLGQSGFDYFGGGAVDQRQGKNNDQPDAVELAVAQGYRYVNSKEDFEALKPGAGKVIAVNPVLQDSGSLPYAIDRQTGDLSLADYTRKGIELLQDNPQGFFMMIEGGKIDWCGHANDAGTSVNEVLDLDAAIREAVAFADKHPRETLIVVTGDHETGGMTLGFAGTRYETYFSRVASQKKSFIAFNNDVLTPYKRNTPRNAAKLADLLPAIEETFGILYSDLTPYQQEQVEFAFQRSMGNEEIRPIEEDQYLLYGGYEPLTVKLTQILNQTAGIGWTSYSHTGVPVATFARGAAQDLFSGYYDNTDIFKKLAAVMGLRI